MKKDKVTRKGTLVQKKSLFCSRPAHMLVVGFDGLIGPPHSQRIKELSVNVQELVIATKVQISFLQFGDM